MSMQIVSTSAGSSPAAISAPIDTEPPAARA